MAEEGREPEKGDIDEARRRVLWQALMGGPVILTLSSRPAWASNYGYNNPPHCHWHWRWRRWRWWWVCD